MLAKSMRIFPMLSVAMFLATWLTACGAQLPFLPERIGSWWDQRRPTSSEVGVLALSDSERALLAGECKGSAHPAGLDILEGFENQPQVLQQS